MRSDIIPTLAAAMAIACSACSSERGAATRGDSATAPDSSAASTPASASPTRDARLRLGSPASGDLAIGPATTEQELIAAFGAASVTRESVALAEGESRVTTVLFASDSVRRLEIFWTDSLARTAPESVRLQGARSAWSFGAVTLGAGLAEIEAANGRPFKLLGFHWDYEGTVSSWEGGRLDSLPPSAGTPLVRFRPTAFGDVSDEEGGRISGDREFLSTDPLIRRVKPRVYSIEVRYGNPG